MARAKYYIKQQTKYSDGTKSEEATVYETTTKRDVESLYRRLKRHTQGAIEIRMGYFTATYILSVLIAETEVWIERKF